MQMGGFDGFLHFLTSSRATYDSKTFVDEALTIVATLVWRASRLAVQKARYVGLMCDEATHEPFETGPAAGFDIPTAPPSRVRVPRILADLGFPGVTGMGQQR